MSAVRSSWVSKLTYVPLAALAVVNIALVLGFWSKMAAEQALAYQVLGASFAVIEMSALVVISDAAARGETVKAHVWRVVLVLVLIVNLFADFGAVVSMSGQDADNRARAVAAYDAAARSEREADAEIIRLTAMLETQGANRPAAALEAEMRSLQLRRENMVNAGVQPSRRLLERAVAAEAAFATAAEIERLRGERDRARATLTAAGARPATEHWQFKGIADLAGMLGVSVSGEQARVGVGAVLALVLRLVLLFGFWAVTPRLAMQAPDEPAPAPQPLAEAPTHSIEKPRRIRSRRVSTAPENAVHKAIEDLERGLI